jgi:putative FmdB family regulatory protein
MPTYEYECGACGQRFEKFQSIMAAPVRTCPACGKRKARRLIGAGGGVIFKGSGFYQTDYRSESYKKGAEKEKPAVATGASKGESKGAAPGDSKAAAADGAKSASAAPAGGAAERKKKAD